VGSETLSYRRLCINILIKCPRSERARFISLFPLFIFFVAYRAALSPLFFSQARIVTNFIQIGRRQIKGMAG
jgi:hypothetical protein